MRYTLLGRSGLRVSQVCLGTMTFGSDWGWGADEEECRRQFDLFAERGGNFVDTADKYTDGSAERILGAILEGQRDRFVLSTKYSLNSDPTDPNGGGNQRKNLARSLEASLRRLRTDYVDVLWVHAWDFLTPPEEIMRALDDQVRLGKVHYVGISDAPAWRVAQCNTIAEFRGWSAFLGVQVPYSLTRRDADRELLPMARGMGMTTLAWAPLDSGLLSGKYTRPGASGKGRVRGEIAPEKLQVARLVDEIADEIGASSSQVAIAWVRSQPGVIPILGARTAEQLADNLGCLDVTLSPEQLARLDEASRIPLGFPLEFLASTDFIGGGMTELVDVPAGR